MEWDPEVHFLWSSDLLKTNNIASYHFEEGKTYRNYNLNSKIGISHEDPNPNS